jgi:hypothetical protein
MPIRCAIPWKKFIRTKTIPLTLRRAGKHCELTEHGFEAIFAQLEYSTQFTPLILEPCSVGMDSMPKGMFG